MIHSLFPPISLKIDLYEKELKTMLEYIKKYQYRIGLVVISFLFLLFYSANTSPLYPDFHGWDSAFFTLAGRMIHSGKIPYVDIIDSKGPLLYWIYALGDCFPDVRTGVWLLQLVSFFISIYFAFRMVRLFTNNEKKIFFILSTGILIWMGTFENGGLTEEFSLPFLVSGLYFLVRYIRGSSLNHPPLYAFWYGISFSCMLLIRITNAALLCGFIASVSVVLFYKKQWKNLFQNMLSFFVGCALIIFPVIYYFYCNNALDDLFLGMFQLAGNYAGSGLGNLNLKSLLTWTCENSLLLFSLVITVLYARRRNTYCGYSAFFADIVLLFVLRLGNGYLHYLTLVVPAFLISLGMLTEMLPDCHPLHLRQRLSCSGFSFFLITALFIIALFYHGKYSILTTGGNSLKAVTKYYKETYTAIQLQTDLIPSEERDSVLAYNIRPRWYVIGNLHPCYRLGAFQESFTRLVPALYEELSESLQNNPPLWIAVEPEHLDYPQLEQMLSSDYQLVDESVGTSLYRKKERQAAP